MHKTIILCTAANDFRVYSVILLEVMFELNKAIIVSARSAFHATISKSYLIGCISIRLPLCPDPDLLSPFLRLPGLPRWEGYWEVGRPYAFLVGAEMCQMKVVETRVGGQIEAATFLST